MQLRADQEQQLRRIVERSKTDRRFFARAFFGLDLSPKQAEAVDLAGRVPRDVAR